VFGQHAPVTEPTLDDRPSADADRDRRVELFATVLLAIATVLTAWSAFQSAKWGGVQATSFAEASAARTESTRASTTAGQEVIVDVTTFMEWATAVAAETADEPPDAQGDYVPQPDTLSGFLFERFRDEFKPAVDAWLATDPLNNPDAPPTPFATDAYVLEAQEESRRLEAEAEQKGEEARDANQRSDNYVLTAVLFAAVLFFAGIGTKLRAFRNRIFALSFAVLLLVSSAAVIATFPIEI
jgi:hypothetical protein